MSTNVYGKDGIECTGNICGLYACRKHKVEVRHNNTSDTVSVWVDGEFYGGFDDPIWAAIVDVENAAREEWKKQREAQEYQ